jgi:hypothetical protein
LPGHVDRLRGGPEEPPGQVTVAAGQGVLQRGCLQRGHRHAQGVRRVGAAERIAEDQQPGREAPQPLVAAAKVGREPVGDDVVERFSVADRGDDVGRGGGLDEGEEAFGVGRRVVAVVPDRRQDPPVLLLREQHEPGGPARLGPDGDELLAAQGAGAQAKLSGGVPQLDREPLFRRLVVAHGRKPGRRPAAAPGRVQDQVGVDGLLGAAGVAPQYPHPGDAVSGRGGDQPEDLAPVDDLDRGQRPDPGANVTFQVGPAGLADEGVRGAALEAEKMTGRGEAELREVPDHRCAARDEVVEQSGEELVEDLRPSGEQHMGVSALGYTPSMLGRGGERVAFHDGDPLVRVGQHPGGEEPGDARPKDHRVVTDLPHLAPTAL